MQEVIRTFRKWLEKRADFYEDTLADAEDLFWSDREDVAPIDSSQENESFFNEWLMLDFSVNGYDDTPAKERKNFLSLFLKEKPFELSEEGRIFAKNMDESFISFYRVIGIKYGEYIDLEDLFFKEKIRVWDVNASKNSEKDAILYGRFCKNEEEKYIGAGSHSTYIPEEFFNALNYLITNTFRSVVDERADMTLKEFFKWNSYIYYREINCSQREEMSKEFDNLSEKEMVEILKQGNLTNKDFQNLIESMKKKGLSGSIMAVDNPDSEEGKVVTEYIKYHKKIPESYYKNMPKKEIEWSKNTLISSSSSMDDKKRSIILLAHAVSPDAFKFLDKYGENPDPKLKIWVNMAIQECQNFLESKILDEPVLNIGKVTKIGRNESCSCGSGKKYKKCCLKKQRNEQIFN